MAGALFDLRTPLLQEAFASAQPFRDYVETGAPGHQEKWISSYERLALTSSQKALLAGFKRKLNVLVLSGTWCGDCSRQCPMLQRISEASSQIDLRFLDNESNPVLRDEYRIHGAARVPVVITLSEDFLEINRFGDRTLSVYQRKAATELGAACDIGTLGPNQDVAIELDEWVNHFERLHLMLRVSPYLRKRHND